MAELKQEPFKSKVINRHTGEFLKEVDSVYLRDPAGNIVLNQNGDPYPIPANMDFNAKIQEFQATNNDLSDIGSATYKA